MRHFISLFPVAMLSASASLWLQTWMIESDPGMLGVTAAFSAAAVFSLIYSFIEEN